jgi:hypothetical protein
MNTRLRPDYLDPFINVARLICSGDAPPWLAEQLWCFNRWLYQDRHVEEILPTRARMRSNLRKIEEGSFRLALALQGPWVQEFLDGSPDGPVVERRIRELEDLSYRAGLARNCPALATKSGATRPGPGRAEPHEISPRTLCAIIVWEAWKLFHGEAPSPKNPRLAEAVEAYWRAADGEAHSCGEEPLAVWRHHFKKAARSTAKDLRVELRRRLVLSELDWNRRNSGPKAA